MAAEKKQKNFEKIVGEWKLKVDELAHELDLSQKDARNASQELFKMKAKYDEGLEQLDVIKRENKTLSEECKDYMDQIHEDGRKMNDLAKDVRKYEQEKDDLQGGLEEAEIALEAAESKCQKGLLELAAMKGEIERKLQEKRSRI